MMFSRRWWYMLHRSGWEFWLPLPLIAGLVWLVGNQIAAQVLVQPRAAIDRLQAASSDSASTVLTINAQIDRSRNTTNVLVRMADAALETIEYEFATADVKEVERSIAQELNISIEAVRRLASYRIQD